MILRTKALSHRKAQKARSRLQTANPQLAASSLRALVTWLAVSVPAELATRSWRPARPGRAGGARRCWSAAAQMPGRARTGPGLPRGLCARGRRKASVGRSLTLQGACALPRPGASPYEPSRGRGPGSAQFAGGYPGHCVLHGSSVSKSMKPRNEATAGCAQNVRSSCAAGPDVAAAS